MKFLLPFILVFTLTSCGANSSQTLVSPVVSVSGEVQNVQSSQEPYKIGTVDTAFKLIGPDHKIEVGGVPDPKVAGVTCFYSRARTGGISGGLGLAQDTSDASVACRQT